MNEIILIVMIIWGLFVLAYLNKKYFSVLERNYLQEIKLSQHLQIADRFVLRPLFYCVMFINILSLVIAGFVVYYFSLFVEVFSLVGSVILPVIMIILFLPVLALCKVIAK